MTTAARCGKQEDSEGEKIGGGGVGGLLQRILLLL